MRKERSRKSLSYKHMFGEKGKGRKEERIKMYLTKVKMVD